MLHHNGSCVEDETWKFSSCQNGDEIISTCCMFVFPKQHVHLIPMSWKQAKASVCGFTKIFTVFRYLPKFVGRDHDTIKFASRSLVRQ